MRITRIALIAVLTLTFLVVPSLVMAQSAFDDGFHIVPDASAIDASCPEGAPLSFGAVMKMIQSLVNVSISIGAIIFTAIMAWAGVLFITSATNPENRSTARKMLLNGAIGLVIVLTAWLMVDFVMKTLYSGPDGSKGKFGPWNSILGDGPTCVVATTVQPLFSGSITAGELALIGDWETSEGDSGTGTGTGTGSGSNCPAASPSGMVAFAASVTSGDPEKATPTTVRNFMAMRAAALQDGIDIKVVDGYRPESEQLYLWNRYCSSGVCGEKKVGKPCSLGGGGSNHNSGVALDLTVGCGNGVRNCNTRAYNWLKANGSRWNLNNNLPTDPPHWSPSGR